VRLAVRASSEASIEVHVRDEGVGFPPDFLSRAFERFTRPSTDRGGGGTGLGLSIARTIASAHGGRAGAANGEQGGADVWITLPSLSTSAVFEHAPGRDRTHV